MNSTASILKMHSLSQNNNLRVLQKKAKTKKPEKAEAENQWVESIEKQTIFRYKLSQLAKQGSENQKNNQEITDSEKTLKFKLNLDPKFYETGELSRIEVISKYFLYLSLAFIFVCFGFYLFQKLGTYLNF